MAENSPLLRLQELTVHAGDRPLLAGVNAVVHRGEVLGLTGPSGAGKSTLLRCLNRLIDLAGGLRVSGQVYFHDEPLYQSGVDADALREKIGILFQQPVLFPASIGENVLFGARRLGKVRRQERPALIEKVLREAALWEEVKDRLHHPASQLSVGQQQRLCLARTLAVQPEVILMDEPTSALDPASTEAIESLILRLKGSHTIVLVTHSPEQAQRVCDRILRLDVQDGCGRLVD